MVAAKTARFTIQPVVGGGSFVEGTDVAGNSGACILSDPAWSAYVEHQLLDAAQQEYDKAVEQFFAPLVAAAEAAKPADKKDWTHITVDEPVNGKSGRAIHLGPQGVILRILSETDGSALRWVNGALIALQV